MRDMSRICITYVFGSSLGILDWSCYGTPLYQVHFPNKDHTQDFTYIATRCPCGVWCRGWITPHHIGPLWGKLLLNGLVCKFDIAEKAFSLSCTYMHIRNIYISNSNFLFVKCLCSITVVLTLSMYHYHYLIISAFCIYYHIESIC